MPRTHSLSLIVYLLVFMSLSTSLARAQHADEGSPPLTDRERMLLDRIDKLESRIAALENKQTSGTDASTANPAPATPVQQAQSQSSSANAAVSQSQQQPAPRSSPFAFSDGTTLNFNLDGYYGYNFNHPAARVNLLRANDPLSNSFSLNHAVLMLERNPDVSANRRWGYRLDLMFGQQTEDLQGSSANELRPQAYRNLFQAYGTYILPLGSGLQIDFGKFSSSFGLEGTYAKDQLNYSRSYLYAFLPFYHEGLRAKYNLNKKISLQYWLVNGANQTEDFNGFKSQAALLTFKPNTKVSWNLNYYEGQEELDVVPLYNPGLPSLPTQPGLPTTQVTNRHDGREHILDSYASFQLGSKWSASLEGDYVIHRTAANSAPTRAYGGIGYLHRQLTKAFALNGRYEYLADKGGLFSGQNQVLRTVTATGVYQFADGFQSMLEYRRDFSNHPFFLTNNPLRPARAQDTMTLGLLWWFGGKRGAW